MVANKYILMLGTRFNTMGGIASVVNVYQENGLFVRNRIIYIATHCDGSARKKLVIFLRALAVYLAKCLPGRVGFVHIHVSSRASFWRKSFFFLPAFFLHIPTILHLHGSEFAIFYEQESGSRAKRFISHVFNRASRVVVLSEAWQRWVQGMCVNPHVVAIYNPVTLPAQVTPFETREQQTLLFLGRLGKRKGAYDLVEAVSRLTAEFPDMKLLMGGDGEVEQVREHVQRLGLEKRVELLGWVTGVDKEALLRRASVYLLPSYNEGLPMSVLEAMAAGLPIVSTPVGGIPEAVADGVEGYLVQPGDVDGIAAALARLLGDTDLRRRMGEAARAKVVSTFSAEKIVPQIEALYRELGV